MPALCRGSTQDRRKERRGGGRLIIIMGGRSSNVGSNGQSYNSHQYLQWPARQPLLSPIYDSFAAIMSKFLRSRSSAVSEKNIDKFLSGELEWKFYPLHKMIDLHDESFELVTKLKLSHSRRNTSLVYISTAATKREREAWSGEKGTRRSDCVIRLHFFTSRTQQTLNVSQ